MTYILSKERNKDVSEAFENYDAYIEANKEKFPPSALSLAKSNWYYGFEDHRAPHDSWLERVIVSENASGKRHEVRSITIKIVLLSAYHDRYIELTYPRVFNYELTNGNADRSHGDWLYDEFRLSSAGNLIHEIEWVVDGSPVNWLIEADDVYHKWYEINEI